MMVWFRVWAGGGDEFCRVAERFGTYAERVTAADGIRPAFERAEAAKRPAGTGISVERETDASMGASIDAEREFE